MLCVSLIGWDTRRTPIVRLSVTTKWGHAKHVPTSLVSRHAQHVPPSTYLWYCGLISCTASTSTPRLSGSMSGVIP